MDGGDRALAALDLFVGVGAISGAAYALGGAEGWDESWLERAPFHTFRIPGLILLGVQAPLGIAAGAALLRDDRHATALALADGAVQVGWIATQLKLIGYRSPLQPVFVVAAAASLGLAVRRWRAGR